jgi:hypothetical protein
MKYPIGAMSVGDILGRGFVLFFSRFGLFYSIMLIVDLPLLALRLLLPDIMLSGLGLLALVIPTVILQAIGTGALIRVVMQEYLDRPVRFGESIQFALNRLGSLIGTPFWPGLSLAWVCSPVCYRASISPSSTAWPVRPSSLRIGVEWMLSTEANR